MSTESNYDYDKAIIFVIALCLVAVGVWSSISYGLEGLVVFIAAMLLLLLGKKLIELPW